MSDVKGKVGQVISKRKGSVREVLKLEMFSSNILKKTWNVSKIMLQEI